MYLRVLVMGLSGVLHPEDKPIDTAKPLMWLPILEELLEPWRDVRIGITSSRKHTPQVAELRLLLGSLAPRFLAGRLRFFPKKTRLLHLSAQSTVSLSTWLSSQMTSTCRGEASAT